jgi:UDP-N-acetylmuramoylalanine--D-glutamate ligase
MNNLQQFLEKCPCPVVGVSGGDGRTTAAQLIYLILSEAGKNAYLCEDGVVDVDGVDVDLMKDDAQSFLGKLTQDSFVVMDMNTADLKDLSLKLRVAVVVESLMNVLQSQKAEDFCVVSLDRSYGEKMQNGSAAQKFPVSRTQAVTHGAHIEGPAIIFCAPGVCQMVGNMSKVLLKGADDAENILAAVAAARVLQIPVPVIQKVLYSFEGDEAALKDGEV